VVRKIEAIICSDKLDILRKALLQEGIQKMTVTEVHDYGSQKAHMEIYRSEVFSMDSLVMAKVEIIVPQKKVSAAVSIITTKVHTGKAGENKILVSSVNDITQVYSCEKGESV
jgi:nitrogen regulatory protein P-II 1